MGNDHSSPGLKVKVISQGQCKNVCGTQVSTVAFYEYLLTAIIVGVYRPVISYALARRGVRRGSAVASGSDNADGLTPIFHRAQFFLVCLLKFALLFRTFNNRRLYVCLFFCVISEFSKKQMQS